MTTDTGDTWQALQAALEAHDPSCLDDNRFILDPDQLAPAEKRWMRQLCASCPIRSPCDAYATAERVRAGFWAGRHRGTR